MFIIITGSKMNGSPISTSTKGQQCDASIRAIVLVLLL